MTTRTAQRESFLRDTLDTCVGCIGPWGRVTDENDGQYVILEVGNGDLNPTGEVFVDRTLIGNFNLTGFRHIANLDTIDRGLQLLMATECIADLRAISEGRFRVQPASSAIDAHLTDGRVGWVCDEVADYILQYGALGEVRY